MIKKIINSKFKKDLSFSYISQAITVSFGFLQLFLINKYFGLEVYGQLAILISTAGIFSSLLTARSSEAVTRFFKREELNQNYENAKFVIFIGFVIDIATALLLVLSIYLLSDLIADLFLKNTDLSNDIVLYSFITFIVFLRGSILGFFQSKEMFINLNMITIIESFSKIILLLISIFMLHRILLSDLIIVFLLASIISFMYAIVIFLKSFLPIYKNITVKFDKILFQEYWKFNIKTFVSSSLKAGNQNIDNLILGYFFNAGIVGIYQIMKKVLSPILITASPFSLLVYPKLIHFYEMNKRIEFKNLINKISFYIFIISIFYSTLSYIFIDDIFLLMDISYLENSHIIFLLIIILYIINAQMWWVRAFSNTVNPKYSIYINLYATIFQLVVTILMSKFFGFYGMLISIIIMQSTILIYILAKRSKFVSA